MCPAIIALSEIRHTRVALSEMKRFGVKTILDIRIFAYDCGPCRARSWDIFKYWGQLSEETVRAMKKLWNLTVVHTGYSCYLSLDMGPGAAACGMEIEINTGYSWSSETCPHWQKITDSCLLTWIVIQLTECNNVLLFWPLSYCQYLAWTPGPSEAL